MELDLQNESTTESPALIPCKEDEEIWRENLILHICRKLTQREYKNVS